MKDEWKVRLDRIGKAKPRQGMTRQGKAGQDMSMRRSTKRVKSEEKIENKNKQKSSLEVIIPNSCLEHYIMLELGLS